jgi:Flp pilus assembly protein TadB
MDPQCGQGQVGQGQFGQGRPFWYGGPRWSSSYDPSIRVSDAERTQMSDTLSKHYAEGRLDDAEFKLRLDKAMGAKTRGDLSGLLADLPPLQAEAPRRRPGIFRSAWWGFTLLAMVFLALWLVSALTTPHIPWVLVIVVLAVVWHRRSGRFGHHHHGHHDRYPVNY